MSSFLLPLGPSLPNLKSNTLSLKLPQVLLRRIRGASRTSDILWLAPSVIFMGMDLYVMSTSSNVMDNSRALPQNLHHGLVCFPSLLSLNSMQTTVKRGEGDHSDRVGRGVQVFFSFVQEAKHFKTVSASISFLHIFCLIRQSTGMMSSTTFANKASCKTNASPC